MSNALPVVRTEALNLHLVSGKTPLHILKDVDFAIEPGEVVAVVGPSGSGKTSLLMVLAGLERATSGVIRYGERDVSGEGEDQLARLRRRTLGILFQNFHLIPSMTALENVALALEIADLSLDYASLRERARAALVAVGLEHRLTHLPNALSGGEQQRVGLARALVGEPKLLLADEPTGNLDQETGGRIIDLMFESARARGSAVLLITHDQRLASRADRTLVMDQGRLASGGWGDAA